MNAEQFLKDFQDYLVPRLDVYEQALYMYLVRHSRLLGELEVTVGLKSARRRLGFGVGKAQTPPSERIIYEKLRSLAAKGCVVVIDSQHRGTRVKVYLPGEINGIVQGLQNAPGAASLDEADFFLVPENRALILEREGHRCFYCKRKLDGSNYVIEHVTSRPAGDNSYRNVVAACRSCNNRKGSLEPEAFLRVLLREQYLDDDEFSERRSALGQLCGGHLRLLWPPVCSATGAS